MRYLIRMRNIDGKVENYFKLSTDKTTTINSILAYLKDKFEREISTYTFCVRIPENEPLFRLGYRNNSCLDFQFYSPNKTEKELSSEKLLESES